MRRYERAVKKTAEYFEKASVRKAVLGLSGGIDSALAAKLLCDAIGKENVFAILMPDAISSRKDIEHAVGLCKLLGIKHKVINIEPILRQIRKSSLIKSRLAEGNAKARIRMVLLYAYANSNRALVVGTTNRTELKLGYFTKYGDGGCDLMPLAGFYKSEIFKLASMLGLPQEIINKKPSAGFWKGQSDEKEIGMSYARIDEILRCVEKRRKCMLLSEDAKKIIERIERNSHKLRMPAVIS